MPPPPGSTLLFEADLLLDSLIMLGKLTREPQESAGLYLPNTGKLGFLLTEPSPHLKELFKYVGNPNKVEKSLL